jgi:predicted ATPase
MTDIGVRDPFHTGIKVGEGLCSCKKNQHPMKKVVVTGGPGAGKTAVLELAQKVFCPHVAFVPEGASVLFGGGFWRLDSLEGRKSAQRAIYFVQKELEAMVQNEKSCVAALCDRGTIDGLAYWPASEEEFWRSVKRDKEKELAKYQSVIHLRTPAYGGGYGYSNPVRIENADEARRIDDKLIEIWRDHPNQRVIDTEKHFMIKAVRALEVIQEELPACCKSQEALQVFRFGNHQKD